MSLPSPITVTDELLHFLIREVQGLRADLVAAREPQADEPKADAATPKPAAPKRKRGAA